MNRPKVAASVACAAAITLLAAACSSSSSGASSSSSGGSSSAKSVIFGIVDDFSGEQGSQGAQAYQGEQLAVKNINSSGGIASLGGAKIVLEKFDTQSDPSQGVPEVTKALQSGASVIIGGHVSDTVAAAESVTYRAGVPWIDIDAPIPYKFNTTFTISPSNDAYAAAYVGLVNSLVTSLKIPTPAKTSLSYAETSFGEEAIAGIKSGLPASKFTVIGDVGYPEGGTGLSAIAERMVEGNPDIIITQGLPADGQSLAQIFHSTVNTTAKIFVCDANITQVASQLGTQANGIITYSAPNATAFKDMPSSFLKVNSEFQAAYGIPLPEPAYNSYLGVIAAAAAINKAGSTSGPAISAALRTISISTAQGSISPGGPLTFNAQQQSSSPAFLAQIQNGKDVGVWPTALEGAPPIAFR
jgi:branched-chain amino acid transport system substrate-binding protein